MVSLFNGNFIATMRFTFYIVNHCNQRHSEEDRRIGLPGSMLDLAITLTYPEVTNNADFTVPYNSDVIMLYK